MVGTFLDDSELIYWYKISNKYRKAKKYGNNAGIVSAEKTKVFLFIYIIICR